MKATEIIKDYNLKYDTASGHYVCTIENKDKKDVIYELIEVNESLCIFFGIAPLFGGRSSFAVENDLPALEHWARDEKGNFHCSRCGAEACCLRRNDDRAYMVLTSFCYHCGAKMDIDYDESENE